MKKWLVYFSLNLLLYGCAQVYFASPQPQKGTTIKSFIAGVQGDYSDSLIDISILKKEMVISGERYRVSSKYPNENEVLVKYYNDFYFVSFKDSVYYSVFMCNFYENKLAIYTLNADEYSINKLKRVLAVEEINEEKNWYLVNPSKKEFDDIVDYGMFELISILERK